MPMSSTQQELFIAEFLPEKRQSRLYDNNARSAKEFPAIAEVGPPARAAPGVGAWLWVSVHHGGEAPIRSRHR